MVDDNLSEQSKCLKEGSCKLRTWDLGCLYVLKTRLIEGGDPCQGDATAERIHEGYVLCIIPPLVTLPRFIIWLGIWYFGRRPGGKGVRHDPSQNEAPLGV